MKNIISLAIFFAFNNVVIAQNVDIPDPYFLNFLIEEGFDLNGDGAIQFSEAALVQKMVSDQDVITDYTGINAFVNLDSLTITNNDNLEKLEIGSLLNLVYLNCGMNKIDTLNLENLTGLKHLDCQQNSIVNLDLTGLPNLESIDCSSNSFNNLNLSPTPFLKRLDCNRNYIVELDLSTLSFLEFLNCNLNRIETLEVSNKANLHSLNCEQNEMTELSLLNLPGLKSLNCRANNLIMLDVSALDSLVSINCFDNDITVLDVSQMFDLKYLNCNKNEIAVLDISNLTKLERLECKVNEITKLDVAKLTELKFIDCSTNVNIDQLDLTNLTKLSYLDCTNLLKVRTLNLSNITQECDITLSNMDNLETLFIRNGFTDKLTLSGLDDLYFICADEFEIESIQSLINDPLLTVGTFCPHTFGTLPYFVKGQVLYSTEVDNCETEGMPIDRMKFRISDGVESSTIGSTSDGYAIRFNEGSYTIVPVIDESLFIVEPKEFSVNLPEDDSIVYQNICVYPTTLQSDVGIVFIPIEEAMPGFDAAYKIIYTNHGNTQASGNIELYFYDNFMDFQSASPAINHAEFGKLEWTYSELLPFESREISLSFKVNSPMDDPPVNGDDLLSFTTRITLEDMQDIRPVDNQSSIRQIVVNSFDPNDKTCLEGTKLEPELVGEFLHYMIRFENTGTANAINIVVRDSLDASVFDIETLELVNSSHRMNTLINGNIVEFVFSDIYLPFNDEDNDGYLIFKLKTKNTLEIGDVIENTAAIYFDYNFPIITNTTKTTVAITVSTNEIPAASEFEIFPNPAKNLITISSMSPMLKMEIIDIQGRIILQNKLMDRPSNLQFQVADLSEGMYLIRIHTELGIAYKNLIIQGE